jgi:hypothetical protein
MARRCRVRDARWVSTADEAVVERLAGSPSTVTAYTVPTTGLRPERE